MNKLIKIHPEDNVLVACERIMPGECRLWEGREIRFTGQIGIGHKIAARDIRRSEKIIKFGVPIGTAVADIPMGAHIHLHNLKSDYIPTYTLDHEFIQSGKP